MMDRGDNDEKIVRDVRLNVAFEHAITAVLVGALATGALSFLLAVFSIVFEGGFGLVALGGAFVSSLAKGFFVFIAGFFFSITVMTPLFALLERAQYRRGWPFFAAAVAVSLLIMLALEGQATALSRFGVDALAGIFFPALIIAALFVRAIAPYWRAPQEPPPPSNIHYLN
ncbi:MAG: hypothetical protein AAGA09_03555 [Pseudomonadota bacterium]